MRRALAITLAALAVVLAVTQLALPPLAEERVVERLERDGGNAEVTLSGFPALRLLAGDGEVLEVEGRGLRLEPRGDERAFERLDGFDEVRVRLDDVRSGGLEVSSFELVRGEDDDAYRTRITGSASPREVARFLGSALGGVAGQGALGGLLGELAAGALAGGGTAELPFELEAVVESRDGRADAREVEGSIAGLPAGPLAELVVDAVARRL